MTGVKKYYQLKKMHREKSHNITILGCPRNLGSMVRINGLFHLPISGIYR